MHGSLPLLNACNTVRHAAGPQRYQLAWAAGFTSRVFTLSAAPCSTCSARSRCTSRSSPSRASTRLAQGVRRESHKGEMGSLS